MSLNAPGRSPLGAALRSPLGALARALPVDPEISVTLSSAIRNRLLQGGTPYDWVSVYYEVEGVARRVGRNAVAHQQGWLKHLQRIFTGNYNETDLGIRLAGIRKKAGEASLVRLPGDTYQSRAWEIVPTTQFPAWPPTTPGTFQQFPNWLGIGWHHFYMEFTWEGSWTHSSEDDYPEGYLLYIDSDPDEVSGVPWYPLVTVGNYADQPITELGTSTFIYAAVIMDFEVL